MTKHKVFLIFDPFYGAKLGDVAANAPVWVVESVENKEVAARLWKAGGVDITVFRADRFEQILSDLDEHHPGWVELEVHGEVLSEAVLKELTEFGPGGSTVSTPSGFTFVRSPPNS